VVCGAAERPGDHQRLRLSLRIALLTACGSVILGTFAAFVLDRYQRFAGRTLFTGMVSAPLVMPEVIIGLSLLLMLVSVQKMFGFPERGLVTIWLGHTCWAWPMRRWWCNRACRR
jgi:putrescine transport system permease protein